jgi:hypothetical protein
MGSFDMLRPALVRTLKVLYVKAIWLKNERKCGSITVREAIAGITGSISATERQELQNLPDLHSNPSSDPQKDIVPWREYPTIKCTGCLPKG